MIHASCLCGKIQFTISGEIKRATHCHCSMCRKAHGAAFATYGIVAVEQVAIVSGEEFISKYNSSPLVQRWFCSQCGSNLRWLSQKYPNLFEFPFGLLDDDPVKRPSMHIFTASKAPWYEITDGLPQK